MLLGRTLAQARALRAVMQHGTPLVGEEWAADAAKAAAALGLPAAPPLVSVPDLASPMCWGLLRPVVALPGDAGSWDAAMRRAVLRHELAHVARRDGWDVIVCSIAVAAWWFHPLAWVIARRCRLERERACDDLVLASGARPSSYATHLIDLARGSAPASALAMSAADSLEERLRAILAPGLRREASARRPRLLTTGVAFAVVALFASSRLTAAASGMLPADAVRIVATRADGTTLIGRPSPTVLHGVTAAGETELPWREVLSAEVIAPFVVRLRLHGGDVLTMRLPGDRELTTLDGAAVPPDPSQLASLSVLPDVETAADPLAAAGLVLRVETSSTVELAKMAAALPASAVLTTDFVTWDRRAADYAAEPYWPAKFMPQVAMTHHADWSMTLPDDLTFRFVLTRSGILQVGAIGDDEAVISVLSDGGITTPLPWGVQLEAGHRPAAALLGLDPKSTILGALAYVEMLRAAELGFVSGGPRFTVSAYGPEHGTGLVGFDLLPITLRNRLGRPITVVQSAVYGAQPSTRIAYGCPCDGKTYAEAPYWPVVAALNAAWNPLPDPDKDGEIARTVRFQWRDADATFVSTAAHGDNGNTGTVSVDGAVVARFKNWTQRANAWRRGGITPREVKLDITVGWSQAVAYVRAVALGGSVAAANDDGVPVQSWTIPAD